MSIEAFALAALPEITQGDDLAAMILERFRPSDGDLIVVAQKVVSKSEGRFAELTEVTPSGRAIALAEQTEKDPALVELILGESREVLRSAPGVLIVETTCGFVCANAGIDSSNVPGESRVLLLPANPDASARALRGELQARSGARLAVIITDSFGRAWRSGQVDVAIGCAGISPLLDQRGGLDRDGRELTASIQAVADELAAAANLARTKSGGEPVVVVRGRGDLVIDADGPGVLASLRERSQDLFR